MGVTQQQFVDACQTAADQDYSNEVVEQILAVDHFLSTNISAG